MRVFARLEAPAAGVLSQQLIGSVFEAEDLAGVLVGDIIGLEHAEEPPVAFFGFEAVGDRGDGLAEGDSVLDGFLHEGGTGRLVHHGGGYVDRSDHGIERRGGAVHHEGLVELVETRWARGG